MYDLGIIGGMGPEATSEFFKRVVTYTKANCDQEHINVCILNKSSIPDRTSYIIKGGESPLKYLNKCIEDLVGLGVRCFVIPCNTSHFFVDDLQIPSEIRFVNMIDETLIYIGEHYPARNICVLGTSGTIKGKIYEQSKLLSNGSKVLYPSEEDQILIMNIINEIKSGKNKDSVMGELIYALDKIKSYIKEAIFVLACTELSLFSTEISQSFTVVDAMDLLAVRAIEASGYKVNYDTLKVRIPYNV